MMVGTERQNERDYEVGYGKPPKATRFKPGDRGNPRGRPPGSLNLTTIIEKALTQKLSVRKGDKTVQRAAVQVIADTFAVKAAQGDHRALNGMINLLSKCGMWAADRGTAATSPPTEPAAVAPDTRPSDRWIESLDDSRLSDADKIDLSRLAERIDNGGDLTALSSDDFARFKQILDKGRGQSVEPQADDELDQAA